MSTASSEVPAFLVDPADNMAVVLAPAAAGASVCLRGGTAVTEIRALTDIPSGHKIGLADLPEGAEVLRYGRRIGFATRSIRRGEWVHLHNLRSALDERSGGLDLHTGAPKDTPYA